MSENNRKPTKAGRQGGGLRLMVHGLFEFLNALSEDYEILLEFGGGNYIDLSKVKLNRVAIIPRKVKEAVKNDAK